MRVDAGINDFVVEFDARCLGCRDGPGDTPLTVSVSTIPSLQW